MMRRMPPRPARAAAILLLLAATGCARFEPIPDPVHGVAADRYGTTQEAGEGVTITVQVVGWQSEKLTRLDPYVTPLFVEVRNDGPNPVDVSLDRMVLVDNEGTLYRTVPPERLQELLTAPAAGSVAEPADPSVYPYDVELLSTLGALSGGEVPPGTRVRGAVYFQRVNDWAEEITLRITVGGEEREFRFGVR
jgi:hypothetical protein